MMLFLVCVVLLLSGAAANSNVEPRRDVAILQPDNINLQADARVEREGRILRKIVGGYSVTTLFSVITRTTSSIWTCMSVVGGSRRAQRGNMGPTTTPPPPPPPIGYCTGKRRKRALIGTYREGFSDRESLESSNDQNAQNQLNMLENS